VTVDAYFGDLRLRGAAGAGAESELPLESALESALVSAFALDFDGVAAGMAGSSACIAVLTACLN
jgi:hypothetical protein